MSLCRVFACLTGKSRAELMDRGMRSIHGKGPRDAFLEVVSKLSGRVIDIGCGTGVVFDDCPGHTQVVGLDRDYELVRFAKGNAARSSAHVTVAACDAELLCFPDNVFDAAVVQFTLCSVSDPQRALTEIVRVLRPGGLLYLYEHVISQQRVYRFIQNLTAPIWKRIAEGCHWNRDTMALVRTMPLEIEKAESLTLRRSPMPPMPIARVIARKS